MSQYSIKNRFRKTKAWIDFRLKIIEEHNNTCDLCKKKYISKKLQVHHKYNTNYTNLTPDRFMVLDSTCHAFIHKKYKCFDFLKDTCNLID